MLLVFIEAIVPEQQYMHYSKKHQEAKKKITARKKGLHWT
jgi:hypothetical protein